MASARERNGRFTALYRDTDGKQKSASTFATRKEALKAARLAEAGMYTVKTEAAYPIRVRGKVTVASYVSEWLPAHRLSPHAREKYGQIISRHVIPALGARVLADVTAADIRAYFRVLEGQNASGALLAKVKTVMSAMFQTACEDRLCPVNPVRGVRYTAPPPKRRRALTAQEWVLLREHLTGEHRLFCEVQMATGARIEEILGMETTDISDGEWHVQRVRNDVKGEFVSRDMTKNGRTRAVPMDDPDLVKRIMERGPGRVFADVLHDTRRKAWRRACKAAGLDWYPAPRDLRRTFATLARAGGADLEAVRVQLGHRRIATTDLYLGERPEARGEALQAVRKALQGAA